MKKFNLFKEIITANKTDLLKAINSSKLYGINIKGDVVHEPFDEKEIFIYQGQHIQKPVSALMHTKAPTLEEILGKNYQVVIDDERVLIKAFSNWQELIGINTPRASYDDTTADGVDKFANTDLEDIGWHATDFEFDYRPLVDLLEEKVEGTLLCIEQEEPYQFSGLGFIDDDKAAYELLFNHCQAGIKKMMEEDPLYASDKLEDDEITAAKYFKCL